MKKEPDDHARARNTDPWTSHAAARSIPYDKLRESQQFVYECYQTFGPMHHERLVEVYAAARRWRPQSPSGLRSRASELVDAGWLRDSGEVVVLPSKRRSIVWEVDDGQPVEVGEQLTL